MHGSARGHLQALEWVLRGVGIDAFNLGTGVGYSVFDVIGAFEKASGIKIPVRVTARRAGDVAVSYSDPTKAKGVLNWRAAHEIDEMCEDAWRWQLHNPHGYDG